VEHWGIAHYTTMGHELVHVCNHKTAFILEYTLEQVRSAAFQEMTEYWAYSFQKEITNSTLSDFNYRIMDWYINKASIIF